MFQFLAFILSFAFVLAATAKPKIEISNYEYTYQYRGRMMTVEFAFTVTGGVMGVYSRSSLQSYRFLTQSEGGRYTYCGVVEFSNDSYMGIEKEPKILSHDFTGNSCKLVKSADGRILEASLKGTLYYDVGTHFSAQRVPLYHTVRIVPNPGGFMGQPYILNLQVEDSRRMFDRTKDVFIKINEVYN